LIGRKRETSDQQSTLNLNNLLRFFRFLSDNGLLADLKKGLLRALDYETCLFDFFDFADYAAVGDDLVIDLEVRNHFLKGSLLFLLRPNDHEIKDTENDDDHRQQRDQTRTAAFTLKKQK
jgi:hypothetical protein